MARSSRTRYALLGMLTIEDRSGYDLKKEFEGRVRYFWSESIGQIYPTLRALEEERLVESRRERRGSRPTRTIYRITPAGRRALEAWLAEPPVPDSVRNELLLKLYFGPRADPERMLEELRRAEEQASKLLEQLAAFEAEIEAEATDLEQETYWKITLSAGRHVTEARRAWAREAQQRLASLHATAEPTA